MSMFCQRCAIFFLMKEREKKKEEGEDEVDESIVLY